MTSSTLTLSTPGGDIPLVLDERGAGRPVLLLHGGAGPFSMRAFADALAQRTGARVIVPTHPGFDGTARPEALASVADLADLYARLLEEQGLEDAVVIGNSIGGWIAAETAVRSARVGRLVLLDAVGIEVEGHPVAGALPPAELIARSWFDPSRAPVIDPERLSPEARAVLLGNRAALAAYAGTMSDPELAARLAALAVPTLVIWGEADRIVDPEYGRAYAAAIPDARFVELPATGHMPQVETPEPVLDAVAAFVERSDEG